jgi:DNA-binding transcriptional LysR family regulator
MNNLKSLKTFMLIVEEGSIVSAASILGITKAAASKQLIDLETSLNTQLLTRTTRTHKLTDTGRLFYESLKKVFSALAESEAIVNDSYEQPIGTLRITSNRHFGEKYIVNNLKEFISLYPDLKIDLELADRFPDLEKDNIDILCGIEYEGPDHYVRKKIFSANHILCASPDYLAKFGTPKKPEDLKRHRYITHSSRSPDNLLVFSDNKEIYLDFHLRLNDARIMLECALQGLGFIKIFNYHIEEAIRSGALIEILKPYREPEKSIYIYYQQQKFLPKKIRLFLDFLYQKIPAKSKSSHKRILAPVREKEV